ncbi:hypothetical protein SAMN05421777_1092 [Fluoribacter gormanii]|uniref:Uncharacterized protein n=1 Tax=Fluoribacter gormanii TaxID=464 RepID=A0A377GH13_9GAMM|nr:hypothetical protein SAMN05421777_1092 [Fluoribacter gormanii]STO24076.1 Uncharacterised protein [Fluoribacter gormanii]
MRKKILSDHLLNAEQNEHAGHENFIAQFCKWANFGPFLRK